MLMKWENLLFEQDRIVGIITDDTVYLHVNFTAPVRIALRKFYKQTRKVVETEVLPLELVTFDFPAFEKAVELAIPVFAGHFVSN